jgi:hypothetical protein
LCGSDSSMAIFSMSMFAPRSTYVSTR